MSDRHTALRNDDLEARIRASLRARADDIDPAPPSWQDLVERSGAVVVPLRPGDTDVPPAHLAPGHRAPRTSRPWLRPVLAAAAALAVVLGATVLVEGRGDDGDPGPAADDDEVAVRKAPDSPVIPVPGSIDFVSTIAFASPLPDVSMADGPDPATDPKLLAIAYLKEWKLDISRLEQAGLSLEVEEPKQLEPGVMTVWWGVSRPDVGQTIARGPVFVREAGPGRWTVVGTYTTADGLTPTTVTLNGVRRADGEVWFSVGDYSGDPSVLVRLNGVVVHEGDLPDDPNKTFSEPDPAPGKVITIEVQHLEDGQPVSITAMALAPADLPTPTTTVPTAPPVSSP